MNGLTVEVIDKIQELVEGQEKVEDIGGKTFSRFKYERVFSDPRPSHLVFNTLGGLADYVMKNLDEVLEAECMVVIDDYDEVSLYSAVMGEKNDRHLIAKAELRGVDTFQFGKWHEQEAFIIGFASLFCNNLDKESVLNCVTSMTVKMHSGGEDNGVSTTRKASNEIELNGKEAGPVVTLAPFRTFRELDQPESSFIFRTKAIDGVPAAALFEADGGAWKLTAREAIKKFLEVRLENTPILC